MLHNLGPIILLALSSATAVGGASKKPPHIIFILVDDLGFNDVSWHNPGVVMPNIEQLARSGILLEQSYVLPVCSPTRAALLTGRYPFTIGRQSSALKPMRPSGLTLNATLLPETLKKAGYATHMIGKWHLGFCKWEYTPTYRGFDSFMGFYVGGQHYYSHVRQHRAKMSQGKRIDVSGYDYRWNEEPFFPPDKQYSTFAYAARAREIISQHNPAQPLFLYLPFQAVHGPTDAPEPYKQLYSSVQDKKRKTYLGMVTALDDAVGAIVQSLKHSGLYDNSIIVFTTDNGGGIKAGGNNWPLKGHKGTLFEGGVRGPAFVHSPLIQNSGTEHRGLIHVVDWHETLARLARATPPEGLDSVDQWPSITGVAPPPRSQVVLNIADKRGNLKAAIRVGKFKLIVGETRGFTTVDPPEGEVFRVTSAELETFKHDKERAVELAVMRATTFNNSHETGKSSYLVETFPLPKLTTDQVEYDYDGESENEDYTDVCDGLSKKECRHLHRQQVNIGSFQRVGDFFDKNIDMHLFNLEMDPNEETNLLSSRPKVTRRLLRALLQELPRVVLADNPARVPEANPDNYGGVWSPGWC